jgi:hypothetical protein
MCSPIVILKSLLNYRYSWFYAKIGDLNVLTNLEKAWFVQIDKLLLLPIGSKKVFSRKCISASARLAEKTVNVYTVRYA